MNVIKEIEKKRNRKVWERRKERKKEIENEKVRTGT